MSKTNKPPIHRIKLGAIKAAIWENETKAGLRHSVTVARIYRDGDKWEETSSFGRDDLLLVAKVLDLAHTWICEQSKADTTEGKAD